jgi:branched-chain amino acid transport system permease protein
MYISGFVSASKFTITTTADPVIYTLIGGKGTLLGPIFGSVLINLGGEQLSDFTNAYPLFVGLLLVVVALAGPSGLIGVARRTWQRLRAVLETQPTDSLPDAPEEDPGGNQDS